MQRSLIVLTLAGLCFGAHAEARWYKGQTHSHSLWSDGDAPPETVAAWFKERGYNFLVLSEHHILQRGERFASVTENGLLKPGHVAGLKAKFGEDWVETVQDGNSLRMRLKTHEELSARFNEPERFLLIPGEEITTLAGQPHMIGINLREPVKGAKGGAMGRVLAGYIAEIAAQSAVTGEPMIGHVNHLNWREGVTSEDLLEVAGLRFFEVYNGQQACKSWGWPEKHRPPNERHWDIVQSMRLLREPDFVLYGVATDDCHNYYEWDHKKTNPGRGWVMVRAESLDAASIVRAMERGDFYASTGVVVRDIEADAGGYRFHIDAEPGVTYTTRFIGTHRGFDSSSTEVLGEDGKPFPAATRVYSGELGRVLLETTGPSPRYEWTGGELYVRAEVHSSKVQEGGTFADDRERAWLQPVLRRSN